MVLVLETICMKCQILFSGKIKKKITNGQLLEFLPSILSSKTLLDDVFKTNSI